MRPHKFGIGALVDYQPPYAQASGPGGRFVVQRHLPPDDQGNQYRLENHRDGQQRVAHEFDLTPARS
jgi:hypothetical protein